MVAGEGRRLRRHARGSTPELVGKNRTARRGRARYRVDDTIPNLIAKVVSNKEIARNLAIAPEIVNPT